MEKGDADRQRDEAKGRIALALLLINCLKPIHHNTIP